MLRLILGTAGTGKTGWVLRALAARAAAGQSSILLVPEQFSSSAEGMVYRALGDAGSAQVEVASFRTLSERILKHCGGAGLRVLDDAGRAVFVRRALDAVAGQLRAYARQRRSAAFCGLCAQTLQEMKIAGATPARLRQIAEAEDSDKFRELALIYEAYEAAIAGAAMDPEDRLALAARRADCGYLDGRGCFIDSFDGFTAPEYVLLEEILRRCPAVTVALCCDGLAERAGGPDLFTPVRRAAHRLLGLAARAGVPAEKPLTLRQPLRPLAPALAALGSLLAGGEGGAGGAPADEAPPAGQPGRAEVAAAAGAGQPPPQAGSTAAGAEGAAKRPAEADTAAKHPAGGEMAAKWPAVAENDAKLPAPALTLTRAADEWEEVRAAAAEMRRLAAAGVPYGKMALVCRDAARYERVARRQLGLFGIPFFIDAPSTVEHTAPVAFLRAALGLLRQGLVSAQVLALLKTGLCGFDPADIAALENYVFTWQPKAADWRSVFDKNPEGYTQQAVSAAGRAQLAAAEGLRAALVPKLEKFIAGARGADAARLSRRLYLLLDALGAPTHAAARAEAFEARGEFAHAERARRAWDLCMNMLDGMTAMVGNERLSAEEYDELLLILVRSTDFGQAPQSLECVIFTTADRMRLAEPDYCFVVGVAEGEFPMAIGYSGLLNHLDRDRLVAGGIEMPGSFENRSLLEEMFFYRALTAPRRGLHLSWPARAGGEARAMSAALEPLHLALAPPPLVLAPAAQAATPAAAFDLLGAVYRDNSPLAATLYAALEDNGEYARKLALLDVVDNPGAFALARPTALRLILGEEMALSATQAERFYECRFSYYMERVLKARPRRRAEISPVESGTFVHYVLEQVLREAGADFAQCTDEQLASMAENHAGDFIRQFLPDDTARGAWRLGCIRRSTVRLLCFMRDAAAQSAFTVDAVELSIGGGPGELPPLEVAGESGRLVRVSGKVDRVDVLRRDGQTLLCIVDYKTGDKKVTLADLYCGRGMQMMVYMAALCREGGRYPNPVPAAVLYLGADPRPVSGSRADADASPYQIDGLMLKDAEVLRALDAGGRYLPVRYNKDGSPRASRSLAEPEKMAAVLAHVQAKLGEMADGVYAGSFPARPLVKGNERPCDRCYYRAACRHEDGRCEDEVAAPEDVFGPGWGEEGA